MINSLVLRWLQKCNNGEDVSISCWQRVPSCGLTDGEAAWMSCDSTANAKKRKASLLVHKMNCDCCVLVDISAGYYYSVQVDIASKSESWLSCCVLLSSNFDWHWIHLLCVPVEWVVLCYFIFEPPCALSALTLLEGHPNCKKYIRRSVMGTGLTLSDSEQSTS